MKLISLSLSNFRPFQDAYIEFAQGDKGVTVVHGQNGAGKTTLLNALSWILYGEIKFEEGVDQLPNDGAVAQKSESERIRVSGELCFEHERDVYTAARQMEFRKKSGEGLSVVLEDTKLELTVEEGSQKREVGNPQSRLKQILPERLNDLFFFDGEDIDELAEPENVNQVQEAIQNIMGLKILERAIRHLKEVEDEFESRMQKHGSDELQGLISQRRELLDETQDTEQKIETARANVKELNGTIEDIKAQLEELDDSSDLENERSRLEDRREELESRVEDINGEIRSMISDSAYLEFAMPSIQETAKELDELRAEDEIPSELSNNFIQRLLDKGQCICNRELNPGTGSYEAVESRKSGTTVEGMDQAAIRLISHLEQIADSRSSLFDELDELIEERAELTEKIEGLNEDIDEVGSKLEEIETDREHEDPATLEKSRRQKTEKLKEERERAIRLEERLENKQEKLDELEERIERAEEKRGKALTARLRRKAAREVRQELEGTFEEFQSTVRGWSDDLVRETFNKITRKELEAEITEEFKLVIRKKVGDEMIEMNKSTGERQLASLAFIGSLASIAQERYRSENDSPYFTGGIYPVVMDSPFGALDKEHRRHVGQLMPKLADQVVVFATDSQWEGPVEEEMGPHIGQQYWLDYTSGEGEKEYPVTRVEYENPSASGGEST